MVRTRNKQDSEVDFAGRILSLDVRKSRRSASHSLKANGERRRVFSERRSFLSRLRPRSGQRKPYNYAYEDTSDEDSRRKVKPQTLLCDLSPDISKAPSYQSPARRHQSTLKIQPLGFTVHPVSKTSLLRDRARSGTSIADVEPMGIDKTVTFSSVGGLGEHIKALKEMVVFPLLYPEFYEHFKVVPSRGVLFHGPPGTGKTLLARALANECSQGSQKVAFFMRKGADCLCKWVGEAERQLRLLFEKAYEMRPSIIFFDEIDGLAPVRSSRQDQIHSSIVSTLLALMDGIDCRGEIVVIGATNRIDAIDPALRRPGRFDKEFQFLLPNHDERMRMLKIHTANWNPALSDDFVYQLAERCSGYCGADIKGLVTDATQNALRRHYPQIYATSDKLQIDISSIKLSVRDFARAMSALVPAAQRAATNPSIPLDASLRPLLGRVVERARLLLVQRFPFAASQKPVSGKDTNGDQELMTDRHHCSTSGGAGEVISDLASDEDEDDGTPCIFASDTSDDVLLSTTARCGVASFFKLKSFLPSGHQAIFRPRMLLSGPGGFGQTTHVAPAILNLMDHVPVHTLDSTTLFAASARIPEEACANVFHEAKRTAPSVIYMPHVQGLWAVLNDLLRVTMMTLVRSMYPSTPVLILATSETPFAHMDRQLRSLFSCSEGEVVQMENFTADERQKYFSDLILNQTARPPPTHRRAANDGLINGNGGWMCLSQASTTISADTLHPCQDNISVSLPDSVLHTHSREATSLYSEAQCQSRPTAVAAELRKNAEKQAAEPNLCRVSVQMGKRVAALSPAGLSGLVERRQRRASRSTTPYPSSTVTRLVRRTAAVCLSATETPRRSQRIARQTASTTRPGQRKRRCSVDCINRNNSSVSCEKRRTPFSQTLHCWVKHYPCLRSPYNRKQAALSSSCIAVPSSTYAASRLAHSSGRAVNILKPLRKASREQRQLTEKEARKLLEREEDALRELRIFLRDILSKLGRERKFSIFTKPVDIEEALDYYNIIKMPMDLSTVMANIDLHKYTTAAAFLDDIFLICSNALEYNPDRGPTDRAIRHRACALRDMAQALLKAELDPAFEELCQEIHVSRKCRGVDSSKMAPSFCHMGPLVYDICASLPVISSSSRPRVVPDGTRYSRRVRGLDVDNQIPDVMQCAESGKEAFRPPSATDASPGHLVMSASRLTDACSPIGKAFKHCHSSPDGELVAEDGCLLCPGSVTNHITSCTCPTDDESFQVIGLRSTGSRKSLYRQCPLDRPERRRSRRCAFKCVGGSAVCSNFVSGIRSEPCEHCRQPKQSADCQHASQQRPESPCSAANPANVNPSVSGRAARCVDVGVARPATNTAGHCSPVDSFGREEDIAGRISPCSPSRDDVLSDEDLRCERKREISNEASNVVDNCVDSLDIAGHPPGYVDGAECFDVIDNNNSNTARKTVVLGHQQTSDALKSEFVTGTDCTPASGLDALRQSAVDVLKDEELVPMVVDRKRLERLLDSLVGRTVKFNVESLQRLHTAITATIHKHRHCHDKTDLVQELERTVDNACPQTPV